MNKSEYNRRANKEAYMEVPETCPHVDDALADAAVAIKKQTHALRDALCDALARALEAEDRVDELQEEVARLKEEVSILDTELTKAKDFASA